MTQTENRLVECQVVSSDRVPVNGKGDEYGRGWQRNTEWHPRRRKASTKPKWAIVTDTSYCGANGKLRWTHDRKEAEAWAAAMKGGRIVNAEDYVREYKRWQRGERTERP